MLTGRLPQRSLALLSAPPPKNVNVSLEKFRSSWQAAGVTEPKMLKMADDKQTVVPKDDFETPNKLGFRLSVSGLFITWVNEVFFALFLFA